MQSPVYVGVEDRGGLRARGWIARALIVLAGLAAIAASPVHAQDSCGLVPLDRANVRRMTPEQMSFALESPAVEGVFDIRLILGPGLRANPAAVAAFERAAARWEAVIRDPITVNINVDMGAVGPGVIAATTPMSLGADFVDLVNLLSTDAADEPADLAARRLAELVVLPVTLPAGVGFDGTVLFSKANTKAFLDVSAPLDAMFGASDGSIMVGNAFPFDFDNRDGVSPGLVDFETAMTHEIGHVLGFLSVVDSLDDVTPGDSVPVLPLDLFRFPLSADGRPDASDFTTRSRAVSGNVEAMFDDIDHEFRLSTGRLGDGRQASHWKANELTRILIGVMDPTLAPGEVIPVSAADQRALDVLGYEIAAGDAPPDVSIITNGPRLSTIANGAAGLTVAIRANETVQFGAEVSDGDGLGFPVFAGLGNPVPVSLVWSFGGLQPLNGALAIFRPDPQVRFELPTGSPSRSFPVSLTAFDALGDSTAQSINFIASEPPAVFFTANGDRVSGSPFPTALPFADADSPAARAFAAVTGRPLSQPVFRSGQPLQLSAFATDSDGLGFPIFAFAGISAPISFLWDFGGGAAGPFAIFDQNPIVTFNLAPGQQSRTFTVTLTVFDSLGLSTTQSGFITVNQSGPPVVNLTLEGTIVPSGLSELSLPASLAQARPLRLGSVAFDENGLGFPIFASFGITTPVSFLWSFGGGQPANPLDIFAPSPSVTFPVGPGLPTRFPVSLTVFDTTGQSTTRTLNLTLTTSAPLAAAGVVQEGASSR